jgi:hypothetical protein
MAVDAIPPAGANSVTGAIRTAARATGTSFDYLLATARVESDLNPNLTMRSSTATGLFQFIEQTWLGTLKQAGPAFGYGHYADAIAQTASGQYVVADPALRNEIMQLRKDPVANALMGGVFTQQNAAVLANRLGRTPTEGELYIGHFFGPYAGARAIALAGSNPTANAAEIFPAAARANRPIFYDRVGNARSIAGVCAELIRRYQAARAQGAAGTAVAQNVLRPPAAIPAAPVNTPLALPPPASPIPASGSILQPAASQPGAAPLAFAGDGDTTSVASAASAAGPSAAGTARAHDDGMMFHSLFQTGERRNPISPAISELWQPQQPAATPVAGASGEQGTSGNMMLNLFRDRGPSNP